MLFKSDPFRTTKLIEIPAVQALQRLVANKPLPEEFVGKVDTWQKYGFYDYNHDHVLQIVKNEWQSGAHPSKYMDTYLDGYTYTSVD